METATEMDNTHGKGSDEPGRVAFPIKRDTKNDEGSLNLDGLRRSFIMFYCSGRPVRDCAFLR